MKRSTLAASRGPPSPPPLARMRALVPAQRYSEGHMRQSEIYVNVKARLSEENCSSLESVPGAAHGEISCLNSRCRDRSIVTGPAGWERGRAGGDGAATSTQTEEEKHG